MEYVLRVENLGIAYGQKTVVQGVSFTLKQGEIASIVGESGSGKTTVLRCLNGFLPKEGRQSEGTVFLGQEKLSGITKKEWSRIHGAKTGMIFQNPEQSLSPLQTIEKQFCETVRAHRKASGKEIYEEAKELLKTLRFPDPDKIWKSYPFELSGGMCQRVATALAVINRPQLLLADEPTSALDVASQKMTIETLMELRRKENMSVLMVTHNIGVAYLMSDSIGVMHDGKLIEWGSAEDVIKHPKEEYTKKLIASVPQIRLEHADQGREV